MASLQYSKAALDTLRRFHGGRYVVFVEGQDDVPFWREVFDICGLTDVYCKSAGGREEIEKYVKAIVDDDADIVVAKDRDFDDLLCRLTQHPRVLHSFGYSIENTLCGEYAIAALIQLLSYSNDDESSGVSEWFAAVETEMRRLVELDLAVRLEDLPVQVPLDNAYRYLDRKRRCAFVTAAVTNVVRSVGPSVPRHSRQKARQSIAASTRSLRYHLRGHCLFSAVLHYVCHRVFENSKRRPTLSNDALFGLLLGQLKRGLSLTKELPYYKEQIEGLIAAA